MSITLQEASILVFAPHPDDEVIGCGGLISKALDLGAKVKVVYGNVFNEVRRVELEQGLAALAAGNISRIDYTDLFEDFEKGDNWHRGIGYFETLQRIERIVQQSRADIVLSPDTAAYHQDHQLTARAVIGATRPNGATGKHRPSIVAFYEEAADSWSGAAERRNPNWFISLGQDDVDRKVTAMTAHKSQDRPVPSERSVESIRALCVLRGAESGFPHAEAYHMLRLCA